MFVYFDQVLRQQPTMQEKCIALAALKVSFRVQLVSQLVMIIYLLGIPS